jgi:hypothetical protein
MRWHTLIACAVAAAFIVACSGDDGDPPPAAPTGITIADLVGSWDIEVWEYALAADTSQKVDWVSTGLSGTLTIAANGSFTVSPALDAGIGADDGTLTVQGDSIYWDGRNDEEWVHFELNTTLTVRWPETSFVDMDSDSSPEDCWLRVVFRRD